MKIINSRRDASGSAPRLSGKTSRAYLLHVGVRPSSGATTAQHRAALANSSAVVRSDFAAPGDGRTPGAALRRNLIASLFVALCLAGAISARGQKAADLPVPTLDAQA